MKILITGCRGQLGSELRLLSGHYSQHEFIYTDIEELNICDYNAVSEFFKKCKPELIINCAAYTAVDKAEQEKEAAFLLNGDAVDNICRAAKSLSAYLVHVSTDYVFDGTKNSPYIETDAVNPKSVYGNSKLKGEEFILNHDLPAIIIRTSWLYSSFGNNFVKTILRLAKERPELRVIADQAGTPTYARDLALAILEIITRNKLHVKTEIYHYSDSGETNWYEFAKAIIELSGMKTPVQPIETKDYPTAATRPQYSVFSKTKIIRDFNVSIPHWKDSLKECLAVLNNNQ